MKRKLKAFFRFIGNPRLLVCVAIGWMITNGWSYVMFALGTYFDINWMKIVAGAWLTFLWLPVSPEKIATFAIAIALLRWLFPDDQRTLAVLRHGYEKAKAVVLRKKADRAARKEAKNNGETMNKDE